MFLLHFGVQLLLLSSMTAYVISADGREVVRNNLKLHETVIYCRVLTLSRDIKAISSLCHDRSTAIRIHEQLYTIQSISELT